MSISTVVEVEVLALDKSVPFFVTQIPIRANGVPLLALINTGAGLSVASYSLLPLLGIFKVEAAKVPAAIGMAGTPVPFVGAAVVRLQMGGTKLSQLLHFTEEELVPRSADTI
ncbi:unnamed protein product [Nippostrongylus brasiliensis]|uniref:Peptidase A2 domain-containing protein n=1 Tax=Nippostrongylus brasiliensis TaxID=27835 RepID=A0A0N4XYI0_NIPBR|nr:unnamed protein product [Nippostrongylus brasiliensis]